MKRLIESAAFLVFALFALVGCNVQRTYWQANTSVGFQAEKSGDLVRAETELIIALNRARNHLGAEEVSASLFNLGQFYLKYGQSSQAIKLFAESLAIEENLSGANSERTARRLAYLADAYLLERNFDAGRPVVKRVTALMDKLTEPERKFIRALQQAYEEKPEEWAKEVARLESLAGKGDAKSQFELATHYEEGRGAPKDPEKAAQLYQKSANSGYLEAQYYTGVIHDKGRGVPRDDTEARRWYQLAADRGHATAQYNLAIFLLEGRGGAADRKNALNWLRKSSAQGYYGAAQLLRSLESK